MPFLPKPLIPFLAGLIAGAGRAAGGQDSMRSGQKMDPGRLKAPRLGVY